MFGTDSATHLGRNLPACRNAAARVALHRAFTLIELLVVVAIIGLLLAIALPAFSKIRTEVKSRSTAVTIQTLAMGLESFRADRLLGGSYPPSFGIYPPPFSPAGVASPHTQITSHSPPSRDGSFTCGSSSIVPGPIQGANLLAWALVGADLLGSPGFRNVDGIPDDTYSQFHCAYGGWTSDVGCRLAASPGQASGLYALNNGAPVHKRSSPFVDLSRMHLPKHDPTSHTFTAEKLKWSKPLLSTCFLDSFDQPILYYRALVGMPEPIGFDVIPGPGKYRNNGVYCHFDNEYITGGPPIVIEDRSKQRHEIPEQEGIDFGAGPLPENEKPPYGGERPRYHPMAHPGRLPLDPTQPLDAMSPSPPNSFAYKLRDPSSSSLKVYNDHSFILMSAGPDGRFGTGDDIGNFPSNP